MQDPYFTNVEYRIARDDNSISIDKLKSCYDIFSDIIENLDDKGLVELMGGYGSDVDKIYDILLQEVYQVMYGNKYKLDALPNHFDKLSESLEETLRVESLNYFITSVLPEFDMNWHHIDWGEMPLRYSKFLVIAARDHGKSFFWSNAYPCWKMYRYSANKIGFKRVRKDLSLSSRGFLFSFSQQQAVDLLEICKSTIENNEILNKKLFPGRGDGWAKTDITCKNGARLTVKGFGSSVRGAHPGYIIFDDALKDNVVYSQIQRKKSTDYFHAVIMNMIVPDGQVVGVGTPFHANDLYGDLKQKKGWHVREYPAIFPDGRLLWKGRYNLQALLDKRESQGTLIFSREILCRPVTNESTIFPYDVLQKAFVRMEDYTFVRNKESFPVKFDRIVSACDFSISSSVGADYTVMITAGIDEQERIWLIGFKRFKGKKFNEQISIIKSENANFRPDVIFMESNVFQTIFAQESERQGLPVMPHHTGTNKYDLKSGLPSLALLFERGMIKIPRGDQESVDISDMICLELSSVTWTDKGLEGVGEHDDIAMCLWILSLAAKSLQQGFRFRFV